jgi:pimeloyl-ACP methyl ester carboxylesterase
MQNEPWDRVEAVEAEGLRITYRRAGDGPPLVLLHGNPLDSREWRRQFEGLSGRFTVVAWDMPGCGQSSDPPESFRIPDYVRCLASFIQALGLDRPHILGLSFGSGIVLELYHWYPDIPRSLILASAYAGWAGSLSPEAVEQRKQGMLRLISSSPDQLADSLIPTLLTASAPPELIQEVRGSLMDFHPAGQRAILGAGFAEHDLRDVLPTVEVPTLLLYGDQDVRSPLSVAKQMHASMPGSQLAVIPDAGHLCDMEAPDRFNAEVADFLQSVSSGDL